MHHVCSVPWADILITMGVEYHGDVQYHNTMGDIMSTFLVI